jgi:hypothetical protein
MRRHIFFLAFLAALTSPLFSQTTTNFQSAESGIWSDPAIWEKNESGIWLKPAGNIYPGDSHDRNANVTIGDGSTVMVGKDQVVQINSLSIINGRVDVEGTLIVGPAQNDPDEPNTNASPSEDQSPITSIITDAPQLLQNMPNPLAAQFGYETTIQFYLDQSYSSVRVTIYDQLAHVIQKVYEETNPSLGWHQLKVRLDRLQSGSYPLLLELPNTILRRMVTVLR